CIIEINNHTNYILKPFGRYFEWGRIKYETEHCLTIYPNQTSGRDDSSSGIQGYFIYDVLDKNTDKKICQIKLKFNIPYDTYSYRKSIEYEILENYNNCNNNIKIKTNECWGGHGYSHNRCRFTIQ
ncbi:10097_t:CDS:2, partial [Scutellospora calospora]